MDAWLEQLEAANRKLGQEHAEKLEKGKKMKKKELKARIAQLEASYLFLSQENNTLADIIREKNKKLGEYREHESLKKLREKLMGGTEAEIRTREFQAIIRERDAEVKKLTDELRKRDLERANRVLEVRNLKEEIDALTAKIEEQKQTDTPISDLLEDLDVCREDIEVLKEKAEASRKALELEEWAHGMTRKSLDSVTLKLRDAKQECYDLGRLLDEAQETNRKLRAAMTDQTYRLEVMKQTYDFFVEVATKVDQLRNKEIKI